MWIEILLFLFLGACAVCDGVKKEIPLALVWLGMTAAAVLHIQGMIAGGTWLTIALSILPESCSGYSALLPGKRWDTETDGC